VPHSTAKQSFCVRSAIAAFLGLLLAALVATFTVMPSSADASTGSPVATAAAACEKAQVSVNDAGMFACARPYAPTSVFNRALPDDPQLAPDSKAIVSGFQAHGVAFAGGQGTSALTTTSGRIAVYYSTPSDPLVRIHCTYYWGANTCAGANGFVIDKQSVRIPTAAQPAPGGDKHMTIIDQANGREYDFEHATWAPGHRTINVWSGAEVPIGTNLGNGLGSGATAADFADLAGLITEPELASGQIDHALAIDVPCTNGSVYPATMANGQACSEITTYHGGAEPALGQLMQLHMSDAQIAKFHGSAWEKTIMTAMAHYGVYINDTMGPGAPQEISLETESDVSYTSLGNKALMAGFIHRAGGSFYAPNDSWDVSAAKLPIGRLRVLAPCVAQGTCQ
jgi:hypothetical protein